VSDRPRLVEDGGLLILSYFMPPMSVGPAFVIDALLGSLDLSGSLVFTGRPGRYGAHRDTPSRVNADVRRFDLPGWWPESDGLLRLRGIGNVLVALRVALAAVRVLHRREIRGLLVVYPKQHFLLAGTLASLFTLKPFAVYFMDVYVEGLPRGRSIARVIEHLVGRRASVVFAMSEPHREHLAARFRRAQVVELPHPYEEEIEVDGPALHGEPAIVFTGAVYDAQADAIRRLIRVLDTLPSLDPHLYLFSQTSVDDLAREGIREGERVHVRQATRSESRAAQRAAGVLFLPLAFDAKSEVVSTASPSKMPEYLAAARPILVHAPPFSYVVRYAREHQFAEVVDSTDEEALAHAIERLTRDERRRAELVGAARETLEPHRAPRVAETLRLSLRSLG
jgi:glycosyltransferase involved in cell wall biosynthesis